MTWWQLFALGFIGMLWFGEIPDRLRDIAAELKRMNDREEKK
jgi:hypothetical protein